MMKKLIITALLIAALFATPVFAADNAIDENGQMTNPDAGCVWINDRCLNAEDYAKYVGGAKVVYNPKTDTYSKYKDTDPSKSPEVWAAQNSCSAIEGHVLSGFNLFTKEVLLTNDASDQNVTPKIIPILADGTFRYDGPVAQGDYTLHIIPPFEGLGPDQYAKVHCTNGIARPGSDLLGYAVSGSPPDVCQREIISAEYGAFEDVCEEVLVTPAWTEHFGKYNFECNHWHHGICTSYDYVNVGQGNGDYVRHCGMFGCHYDYVAPVNHPAEYETVCEQVGGYSDVTQNVRDVVNAGHLSFLFDNAHNPGGIFDVTTTTLLSEIGDPAKGIVKHVSITYKDCSGNEQHVSTEEYEVINLA
jgi:hypothetical protein